MLIQGIERGKRKPSELIRVMWPLSSALFGDDPMVAELWLQLHQFYLLPLPSAARKRSPEGSLEIADDTMSRYSRHVSITTMVPQCKALPPEAQTES